MSSRAVRQFRARNPNQHQLLTGLVVDRQMSLLERGAKPYMRGLSPVLVEDGDGEERGRARRRTRGGKMGMGRRGAEQGEELGEGKQSLGQRLYYRFAASALVHLDKQPLLGQHLDLLHLGRLHLN